MYKGNSRPGSAGRTRRTLPPRVAGRACCERPCSVLRFQRATRLGCLRHQEPEGKPCMVSLRPLPNCGAGGCLRRPTGFTLWNPLRTHACSNGVSQQKHCGWYAGRSPFLQAGRRRGLPLAAGAPPRRSAAAARLPRPTRGPCGTKRAGTCGPGPLAVMRGTSRCRPRPEKARPTTRICRVA